MTEQERLEQARLENFKQELKVLLEKYNASIGFDADGTQEAYNAKIIVEFDNTHEQTLTRGWWLEDWRL